MISVAAVITVATGAVVVAIIAVGIVAAKADNADIIAIMIGPTIFNQSLP